jgi:hypothetical protein
MRLTPEPRERRVIVGDTHGDHANLRRLLVAAGVIGDDGGKLSGVWCCHVGDVIHAGHGVQAADTACLELALRACDCLVLGNHETPYTHRIGGFAGMNERLECAPLLERSMRDGRWTPATSVDGYLVVHGGLHPILARHLDGPRSEDAAQFAAALRAAFERRVAGGAPDPLFDAIGRAHGGSDDRGGIFWCDWGELMRADRKHRSPVRQIVGHTPRRRVQRTADGRFWCVDLGAALSGSLGGLVRDPGDDDWHPVRVSSTQG